MREDEEPHTPAVWERLIVDAAVIGGPERWQTRLHGLREELHRRYREEQDPALERKIAALENLQELALPIIDKLAALPARATWGEWIAALLDLAEFTLREPDRVAGAAGATRSDGRHRPGRARARCCWCSVRG